MVIPDNVVVAAGTIRDVKQEAISQLRCCGEYILEHAEDLVGEMDFTLDPHGLVFTIELSTMAVPTVTSKHTYLVCK